MEDGRIYIFGQEFNTWFAEGSPSYATEVTIHNVSENTTDCFTITLRITYTETQYYKKYTAYAPGPVDVEYIDKYESTVLFTEDIDFKFIAGENLHDAIMAQEATLQAALDGYMKEQRIIEAGQGAILSMHITPLTGWNPSE
jgi:hypothetical protein